jgi:hypothetical protein
LRSASGQLMLDQMNPALIVIGVTVPTAFGASVILFAKERTAGSFLQLLGAGLLIVVIFAHIAEAFHLFPRMGWGLPNSAGHYVDLICAVAGLILFPSGYLCRRLWPSPT